MNLLLEEVAARHPAASSQLPPALGPVSLRVAAGEQLAIIGPSGAGKTTLLQVLACCLPPVAGHFQVSEVAPWRLSRRALHRLRASLFLAPQTPPLPPRQRVVTTVLAGRLPGMTWWASVRQWIKPVALPEAQGALARFGVADKLFHRVDRLSGGERQRVGLARALVSPARLWLVDEPLSALDPTRARQVLDALQLAARERGCTLVASLHQVDLALSCFPRIVGLRDGRVMFDAPAPNVTPEMLAALYAQHEHELHPGTAAPADEPAPPASPAVVAMTCR